MVRGILAASAPRSPASTIVFSNNNLRLHTGFVAARGGIRYGAEESLQNTSKTGVDPRGFPMAPGGTIGGRFG